MKRIVHAISLVILLALSTAASALDISRDHSGSWFNPAQDGHGFSVEVLPDGRVLFYWYTYHPDGSPSFIVAIGEPVRNRVIADAYYSYGMVFGEFDPATRTQVRWGTITLEFGSCDSAVLTYESDLDLEGAPQGSGSIPLTRLASIDGLQCSNTPQAGLYQGSFVSEGDAAGDDGLVILAPNGEFAIVRNGKFAALGDWTDSGVNLTASGTAVSADGVTEFSESMSLGGQLSPGYRMIGNYSVAGVDQGRYDLLAVPGLYRRAVPLASLAGQYIFQDIVSGVTGTATLSATGVLAGKDSAECVFQGQVAVPDEEFNLVGVSLVVSKCVAKNQSLAGYGALIDLYELGDSRVLRLITSDGETSRLIDLYR